MEKIRLTMAQALVRYLSAQQIDTPHGRERLFHGVFAIFGHGNVAGLGEALQHARDELPTFRAHNEQAMAHAAIAYAKAARRRSMMACTTSIGPGATNLVTPAALAHVNRLPVLLLPGDTFASRSCDPVLQQIERFDEPGVTANDCLRPVSRYWDRISRPEQLLDSLPRAISVLTDPADCGPVTLALPQDVQAEAYEYPAAFFAPTLHAIRRLGADPEMLRKAAQHISAAKRPLIIAGGGVHYADAHAALASFAERYSVPVAETQAGKGALPWDHPWNTGAIGVTGTSAANELARSADLVIAIGTRLQDFTTGSGHLFADPQCRMLCINVARHDAIKGAMAVQADARRTLEELAALLGDLTFDAGRRSRVRELIATWNAERENAVKAGCESRPGDAAVIGVVNAALPADATIVCAAGGLPGELHKLWRASGPGAYHVDYGYSCMGYEIAGALGVKMQCPGRDVVVLVGDGSYLMLNSEIATAVASGHKLVIVVLDNRGFGCIHRLQRACGGDAYNNLLTNAPQIDFAAHARSLGAVAEKVDGLDALRDALQRALDGDRTAVIVIDTDPEAATAAGGAWWDVPIAATSSSEQVREARRAYQRNVDRN